MKWICWAAALVLLAGCSSEAGGATQHRSKAPTLTLTQVTRQACAGRTAHRYKADEREMLTTDGAGCGQTDVWLFEGPDARDGWVSVAKGNTAVLVGTNWVVAAKVPVLKRAQRHLGGHITGGF